MPRTKQTGRKSTGKSAEENKRWEEEKELRRLAQELKARRRKYKTGCEAFWEVSEETLRAGLVFRGATMGQLAGAWEVFGYYHSAYDWDGDHTESEGVLVSAGRLYITDDGSGKVDVPEGRGLSPLTGNFKVEIEFGPGDVLRYADQKPTIYSSFDFVGEAAPGTMLRKGDRKMGDVAVDEETMDGYDDVVGADYDYSNKMSGHLLHAPIPELRLLEGDMVLAEEHEAFSTKFFARRTDAPVPFPREDYVTVAEKDTRIEELEAEIGRLQDAQAERAGAPAAKRARTTHTAET